MIRVGRRGAQAAPSELSHRLDRGLRVAEITFLVGIAVALVVLQSEYRHLEAVLASQVFSSGGIQTFTTPGSASVVFHLGASKAFGLEISPECTSAFLIAPFAVVGAAIRLGGRVRPGRVTFAVGLAALLLVVANQLRIGLIAALIDTYGLDEGYKWGHLVLGSLLSIAFLGICAALSLYIVSTGRRGNRAVTV